MLQVPAIDVAELFKAVVRANDLANPTDGVGADA
jgi:hypothetical protein